MSSGIRPRRRAHADALEAQAGAWSAGADGERRVAAALDVLPPGWHVHHDRLLRPGRTRTNLDHIVIGPSGLYLVDTKNWAGGTSVHDGNLWQHTSSSSAKGRELDAVARFAGEMEKTLGLPVVPVIALAGGHSTSFPRQRVRGVEIIPFDGLAAWLLAQPQTPGTEGADLLSRRVAHTYPSASTEPAGADPDVLTVADVLAAERSTAPRTPSPVMVRDTSRPRHRGRARRRAVADRWSPRSSAWLPCGRSATWVRTSSATSQLNSGPASPLLPRGPTRWTHPVRPRPVSPWAGPQSRR